MSIEQELENVAYERMLAKAKIQLKKDMERVADTSEQVGYWSGMIYGFWIGVFCVLVFPRILNCLIFLIS